jgi:crossover junction endodeoxyribonuclease RusA
MNAIVFHVYGIPQTKGSAKGFVGRSKRTGKLRAFITNDNTKNAGWAATVSGEAQRARVSSGLSAPVSGPVWLMLHFHVCRPKSLPKRILHATKKPDLDKMIRSVKDALKGVLYMDDAQVVDLVAQKRYSESPGVEITFRELP